MAHQQCTTCYLHFSTESVGICRHRTHAPSRLERLHEFDLMGSSSSHEGFRTARRISVLYSISSLEQHASGQPKMNPEWCISGLKCHSIPDLVLTSVLSMSNATMWVETLVVFGTHRSTEPRISSSHLSADRARRPARFATEPA